MAANLHRYEIRDCEWERISAYLQDDKPKGRGRPGSDARTMLNGILWIARSGAPWRDMPERYGAYTTVYTWYAKWQQSGLIQKILADLAGEADLQDMSLDSTIVKVHQHAAGAKKGVQIPKATKR